MDTIDEIMEICKQALKDAGYEVPYCSKLFQQFSVKTKEGTVGVIFEKAQTRR